MGAAVTLLLTLVGQMVPSVAANEGLISTIINGLIQVVPLIEQEATDILPEIKNIIAALQSSATTMTTNQLAALQALDAQVDAAFEAAATNAQAQDAPPPAATS